jgi:hypothetical protein
MPPWNEVVIFLWDQAGGEEAGSQTLSATSQPAERAQRKTGVDAGYHYALPLGLVMQLG